MTPPGGVGRFLAGRRPRANSGPDWAAFWALARRAAEGARGPARPRLDEALSAARAGGRRLPLRLDADEALSLAERLSVAGFAPTEAPGRAFVAWGAFLLIVRRGDGWALRHPGTGEVTFARAAPFDMAPSDLALPGPAGVGAHVALTHDARGAPFTRALLRVPDRWGLAVALAADPDGAAAAEALAVEFAERARPWDPWAALGGAAAAGGEAMPVRAVAWQTAELPQVGAPASATLLRSLYWAGGGEGLGAALRQEMFAAECSAHGVPLPDPNHPVSDALRAAWRWRHAAARGLRVGREHGTRAGQLPAPEGLVGARFADLPDPFDPLLELLALGYGAGSQEGEAVRLSAPPLRA